MFHLKGRANIRLQGHQKPTSHVSSQETVSSFSSSSSSSTDLSSTSLPSEILSTLEISSRVWVERSEEASSPFTPARCWRFKNRPIQVTFKPWLFCYFPLEVTFNNLLWISGQGNSTHHPQKRSRVQKRRKKSRMWKFWKLDADNRDQY